MEKYQDENLSHCSVWRIILRHTLSLCPLRSRTEGRMHVYRPRSGWPWVGLYVQVFLYVPGLQEKPSNLRLWECFTHTVCDGARTFWLCIANTLWSSAVLGVGVQMTEEIHVCTFVCLCMYTRRSQRSTVGVLVSLHLTFWDMFSHGTRIQLDWVASKLQELFCLCLLSPGIIGTLPHQVSTWAWGIEPRSSCLHALPIGFSPAPNPGHFLQWGSMLTVQCAKSIV